MSNLVTGVARYNLSHESDLCGVCFGEILFEN